MSTSTTSGSAERVAGAHEAGRLLRGGRVDHAAEVPGLVGDHADRAAVDAGQRGDHVARPALGHLEHLAAVHERLDHAAHVVDLARRWWARPRPGRCAATRRGRPDRRSLAGALGEVGEQVAHELDRRAIVLGHELRDAVGRVHARAAQAGRVHVLAHHLAHHAGPGEEHRRLLGHHDEVGQGGRVRAAAGRDAADHRDLRHAARQPHVVPEDAAVAGQRGDAVVHPRAAGGDEADHRRGGALGELHHADDRLGVRLAQRAAGEALVLRVAEHRATGDRAAGADHAVARRHPLGLAPRQHRRPDHVQRAGVAERLEPPVRVERARLLDDARRPFERRMRSARALTRPPGRAPRCARRTRTRSRCRSRGCRRWRAGAPPAARSRGRAPRRAPRS